MRCGPNAPTRTGSRVARFGSKPVAVQEQRCTTTGVAAYPPIWDDPGDVNTSYVLVRRLDSNEWSTIKAMRLAMLAADHAAFDTDIAVAEVADETWWRQWATGDDRVPRAAWGAFKDAACVGMIAAHSDEGDCHVGALWVRPEARGVGAARLLLDAAETWAHDARCSRVVLGVAEWNPLRNYYERRHYTLTGKAVPTRWGHNELEMTKQVGK